MRSDGARGTIRAARRLLLVYILASLLGVSGVNGHSRERQKKSGNKRLVSGNTVCTSEIIYIYDVTEGPDW
ncbi:hypothetical protein EYF80_019913 [Liparis tanakae]|uniref:Uncharacterized protein n=1 Tax=Liparis tanakae TaxID=230148 RepID=A0A4Z2HWY5_9TELE|nr:hypothetical protein EYF80_019913 [Liparis tanakae]